MSGIVTEIQQNAETTKQKLTIVRRPLSVTKNNGRLTVDDGRLLLASVVMDFE
jgi:hypothetical protein